MSSIKYSRQREAIKNYLSSTKEHPSAETVYNVIKEDYPNISLGTVYRNLNLLHEHGELQIIECGDGTVHFDADISPHNHFICNKCGSVIDLEMDPINHINIIAGANFNGKIEGHNVYFYGLCKNCL